MRTLLLISVLFYSAGCRNVADESLLSMEEMDADMEEVYEMAARMRQPLPSEITNVERINKKVIKTGGIDFQSENIKEDYRKIRELLPKFKAYIEDENQSMSPQQINYDLTIRVPSHIYDTLYLSLSAVVFRLDSRYSNIEDVTERYYDLKTRIKNHKALEQRYLELLKKAFVIKDILEIEKNLNEVRTTIESLQGQFNYLSKQVGFSTINLSFYEVLPYAYDSFHRKGFAAKVLSALDSGWQVFLSFLVGVATLWPFVILVIGGIYLFRKFRTMRKKKK